MLSERLEEWALGFKAEGMKEGLQQGVRQGCQEGRQEGEAFALQRLLAKRFGAVPPEMALRIATASREEIEIWLDRVLDASSLEDVFALTAH